jgi:hypothetical protein
MKPLNLDNRPCSPISSNCVIWQGSDIPCIKLCTGDTISDVVFKLATELCTIMDTLKITNYDLSCFNLTACPPDDFQKLIQLIIDKICALENINNSEATGSGNPRGIRSTSTCPDCVVTVAEPFVVGTQTTMQLVDYVNAIGNKITSIIDEILNLQNQITDLNIRVTTLENAVPTPYTLPSISTGCLQAYIAGNPATAGIDIVLNTLLNDANVGYCALKGATGEPAEISAAVQSQLLCINDLTQPLAALPTITTFSAYYAGTWVQDGDLSTAADAINNIWITLCDLYTYVSNFNVNINVQDTNTVNLTFASGILSADVQDTGWVKLVGFDTYMNDTAGTLYEYPQVRRIGNQLHFKGFVVVPLAETTSALRPWLYTNTVNNYEEDPSTGNATTIVTPYQGTGGVILNTFGSIQFNRNGAGNAESVLPTSVIPAGYQLDGAYAHPSGYVPARRIIKIGANTSTMLTSLFSINISETGIFSFGLVKNSEESNINGNNDAWDTSHLNYIISHVVSGESVPQFKTGTNIVHSLAGGGTSDLNLDFPAAYTYPFTCNANDETEVGGFFVSITGLTAFISPCGTLIPTPIPCP